MDQERSPRRGRTVAASVVAIIVVVVVAFIAGRLTAPVSASPGNTSNEAGFARDMQVHHAQAVDMSFIIRDKTDDAAVRLLAYDIATSQLQQEGQMFGWLAAWGLPQADAEPSMTWMTRPGRTSDGHDHGGTSAHTAGDPMPGYATDAQITQLKAATGNAAVTLYLQLMIAHHTGGVEMAQAILDRSTDPTVLNLANSIVTAQTSEITVMQDMLAARS